MKRGLCSNVWEGKRITLIIIIKYVVYSNFVSYLNSNIGVLLFDYHFIGRSSQQAHNYIMFSFPQKTHVIALFSLPSVCIFLF